MTSLVYGPLSGWPYPTTTDRRSPTFRTTWAQTKAMLLDEADRLGADLVVVQFDIAPGAIRRDGELRADARAGPFPGVVVSFGSRFGPLAYATDRYAWRWKGAPMKDWQANVRAVALSLEALRAVDRYGVTRSGEQYRGWQQIEAAKANGSGFASADEAARWMCQQAGLAPGPLNAEHLKAAYRLAAKRLHPDADGDRAAWDRLDSARRLLKDRL